jgi:D-amino-acid dehydrogenase
MHRLAQFSRDRLRELTKSLHLDFERAQGFLVLLRTPRDLAGAEPGIRALTELGAAPQVLDAAACRGIEPGLNAETALHAGVYSRDDEVGNCREFAHLLRREAERSGVRFRFNARVERIAPGAQPRLKIVPTPGRPPGERRFVRTDRRSLGGIGSGAGVDGLPRMASTTGHVERGPSEEAFDAVVVCAAVASRALLRDIGVRLPLLAVHGYSVTAPLRHDDQHLHLEPRAALMDERFKVAISRMGNRVRVAGSAQIGPASAAQDGRAFTTPTRCSTTGSPESPAATRRSGWKGARPMLPDGPPGARCERRRRRVAEPGPWRQRLGPVVRLGASARRRHRGRKTPIEIDGLGIGRLHG